MALTVTINERYNFGAANAVVASLAADTSYPTGGWSLTGTDLGFDKIGSATIRFVQINNNSGYTFSYDYANSKLLVWRGDNANASPAPSVEVSNAVNLSATLTAIRILAISDNVNY
jgi:hypothetical protein